MKNKLSRCTRCNLIIAVLLAIAGSLALFAAQGLASRSPALEWSIVFVVLLAIGVVGLRICTAHADRSNKVTQALREITGSEDLESGVRALRRDKRRVEMILANMADGIIAVDADARITLFNRAAERLFGENADRVVGQKLEQADLHPIIARMAYDCMSAGEDMESEVRLPGPVERVVGIHATPFGGAGDDSAMIILHDLSAVRRHEKNQKEFVSNVSHELRTPITAVKATAEALLGGAKDDEQVVDRFLHNIVTESDRLSALIDDLMEIARRDSGITKTERASVNVAQVVNRAVASLIPLAGQGDVDIQTKVEPDLMGYADEIQIEQLVRNLVDNAVKYTLPGGKVSVEAYETGGVMTISVKDTGIGIPHGEVERIFERFYRVDKARSRRLGGTGLGLAIVKDIVEAHGGDIEVEARLGEGSTFTVTLPARGSTDQSSEAVRDV